MRLIDVDRLWDSVKTDVAPFNIAMLSRHIHKAPTIDPETLPIVREMRTQLEAKKIEAEALRSAANSFKIHLAKVTVERDVAMRGELIESIKLCLEKSPDKNTVYVPRTLIEKLAFVMQEDKTAEYFYAVKFEDGSYWSGYNNSDKQLRKAKLWASDKSCGIHMNRQM